MIRIRPYHPDDAPPLLVLFRDTIRRVNSRDYTPKQIAVWASDDINPSAWAARFEGRFVVVAEANTASAGFAELEPDGHIDRFYVSANHQRHGVGHALLAAILAEARRLNLPRLVTETSITTRLFFEAHGFEVLTPQTVVVRGVEFVNYRMARPLTT